MVLATQKRKAEPIGMLRSTKLVFQRRHEKRSREVHGHKCSFPFPQFREFAGLDLVERLRGAVSGEDRGIKQLHELDSIQIFYLPGRQ